MIQKDWHHRYELKNNTENTDIDWPRCIGNRKQQKWRKVQEFWRRKKKKCENRILLVHCSNNRTFTLLKSSLWISKWKTATFHIEDYETGFQMERGKRTGKRNRELNSVSFRKEFLKLILFNFQIFPSFFFFFAFFPTFGRLKFHQTVLRN